MRLINKKNHTYYKNRNTSDAILDFLVEKKVDTVFLLTGGAIAFTVDAFSKRKDISYICVQHEQAAAMMADAYARIKENFSATMTTSGPGATNLITGIACSYFDSIPNIHITGQVNLSEQRGGMPGTMGSRQIGFQETDIVSIAKPITKKAIQLKKNDNILDVMNDLYNCAQSGRKGPVLLDLPMCLQRNIVVKKKKVKKQKLKKNVKKKSIKSLFKMINNAKRPIIIAGGGIRYSNAVDEFNKLVKKLQIPIVTTWSGVDVIDHNSSLYYGHIGVYGSRAANFCVQNADCIISLGSRLDTRITGGKPKTFGREAKIIMVDIDKGELAKRRGLKPYMKINEDCKDFLIRFMKDLKFYNKSYKSEWIAYCNRLKSKYPTVSKKFSDNEKKYVNPYLFTKELSRQLKNKDVIIPDDGGHLTWFMQSFKVKFGQRVFSAFGNSPMGYSFPAAIGASIALGKKRVICIDGDGSFQINMQELQTVVNEKLPIKIFIYNNNGYGIIKQFQSLYLGGRYNASGKGVSIPSYKKIAKAYDIKYLSVSNNSKARNTIKKSLENNEACIIEVFIHPEQKIIPKLAFGNPIEDLSPRLNRKEFNSNMISKVIDSDQQLIESN